MKKEYRYNCVVHRVYDGDTVWLDIDLGFGIWLKEQSIRIMGINTPEIRTKNKLEKMAGEIVTEYAKELLPNKSHCILISREVEGKFGRILGDIQIGDKTLSSLLKDKSYCVEYFGGKKTHFPEDFLINIINDN